MRRVQIWGETTDEPLEVGAAAEEVEARSQAAD